MDETVLLGHGSGGSMMQRIIDRVFLEAYSGIWALHKCGEFHAVAKPKGLRRRDEAKLLGVSRLYYAAGIVVFQGKTALKRALRREKS